MSGFSGITNALNALMANQQALEVTQHNVANVNTPGYRRQEAVLKASQPQRSTGFVASSVGEFGTGVTVDAIRRFSLDFVDGRYRNELANQKMSGTAYELLQQVESSMAETENDSMANQIDNFFAAWQTLSASPDVASLREDLRQRAEDLTRTFNGRATRLNETRLDQNLNIEQKIEEVNTQAAIVANLNIEIGQSEAQGAQPNDLMDNRDRALDRLAELIGAKSSVQDNGMAQVTVGGHVLVMDKTAFSLRTDYTSSRMAYPVWAETPTANPVVEDAIPLQGLNSGELAGLLDVRDRVIPDQLTRLNQTAKTLAEQVNTLQRNGYGLTGTTPTNVDFFTLTTTTDATLGGQEALSIQVSQAVEDDINIIAAAKTAESPGDGSNAQDVARLLTTGLFNNNTVDIKQYNGARVTALALEVNQAKEAEDASKQVATALNDQRESVSGVNLNEEAANMVKYQKAYEAASRILTAFDDMLDRLINGTGRVGI